MLQALIKPPETLCQDKVDTNMNWLLIYYSEIITLV